MLKRITIGLMIILAFATTAIIAQTKADLKIDGQILGYRVCNGSNIDGFSFPLLVKIKRVVAGSEESEYIMVAALLGQMTPKQVKKKFPLGGEMEFSLIRVAVWDRTIKSHTGEAGFVLFKGADAEIINSDVQVPGYRVLESRSPKPTR